MAESSEEVSSDDDRNITESFIKYKKMECHKKPTLYCYHCGLIFPDKKKLMQHFADVYGSSLKNKSSQKYMSCSQNKNMEVNKVSDKLRSSIAKKKYLCLKCKIAFTKRGAVVHRQNQHPDIPKHSRFFEVIKINENSKPIVDKSEIEGNNDNRKRRTPKRNVKDLTKSTADKDIAISKKQDEKEKQTSNKRKLDENNGDNEKPQILRCNQCSLNFVSAEIMELHFNNKCQMSSANNKICDVCGLNFTDEKELIKHLVKHHVNNKCKKFYILIVTNATLVSNNEGILKDNVSPSKKSTESVEDEFKTKKNTSISNMSSQRKKQQKINCNNSKRKLNIFKNDEMVYKLYKCGECNVHYLSSSSCLRHMKDHRPEKPRFIAKCFVCSFVFSNEDVQLQHYLDCHLSVSKFSEENKTKVIVEEYRINTKGELVKEIFHTTLG